MLNISIVLYNPDWTQVRDLCGELCKAKCVRHIYLVDNSQVRGDKLQVTDERVKYIWNEGKNLGYGRANNIAIRESIWLKTRYHLVMNADIRVKAEDIDWLHQFMERNKLVGSVMPRVVYPNGEEQHLCKLLPTPWRLFARRFLPARWTEKGNYRYELRHLGYERMMNVPYLSGCFMFLRTEAVLQARLFDERYFMYPEDMDLTRTMHKDWLTLYVPDVTIVHDHAKASYHSMRMTWIHIVNMCRYFNKWGWVSDPERKLMNHLTETQFDK